MVFGGSVSSATEEADPADSDLKCESSACTGPVLQSYGYVSHIRTERRPVDDGLLLVCETNQQEKRVGEQNGCECKTRTPGRIDGVAYIC